MNDFIGEGNETVELLITTPGNLAGVIPGENDMTSILIIEDDCKFLQAHLVCHLIHLVCLLSLQKNCPFITTNICPFVKYCFVVLNPVIPYQYKQPEYSFTENAATTQVCVETVTGDLQFAPGGNLTIEFFTSSMTATG